MMEKRTPLALLMVCIAVLLACKQNESSAPAPAESADKQAAMAQKSDEVKFTAKVPKPGTTSTVTRDLSLKLTMGSQVRRQSTHHEFRLTVKASDEFRITRAEFDIQEMHQTEQTGTRTERKTVSPLAGSKFTVTRDQKGKLSAVDAEGAPVAKRLVKLLEDDYGDTFDKNTAGAFLPDRPVKLGEKLHPSGSSVMQMMGIKDDGKTAFDGIEFIFKSMDGADATFSMAVTMTSKLAGALRMRAKLGGELTLQIQTVLPVALELDGPVMILDAQGKEKGKGSMKLNFKQDFE